MKRTALLLLLLLSITSGSFGQNSKKIYNDLTEEKLKGKVKSVTKTRYDQDVNTDTASKGSLIFKTISIFNKAGNLVSTDYYTEQLYDHNYKIIYEYDPYGTQLGWTKSIDDGENSSERFSHKYDKHKNRIETTGKGSMGNLLQTEKIIYDSAGRISASIIFDNTENIESKTTYVYHNSGTLIKSTFDFPADSLINNIETYKYNTRGDLIECIIKTSGKETKYKYTYQYDDTGNWTRKIIYSVFEGYPEGYPDKIVERVIVYY